MHPLRPALLLPLVLAVLASCDTPPSPSTPSLGAMQLAVSLSTAAPEDIARVTVTVSASDMTSRSTDLARGAGGWGGVLGDIPAGPGRTFLARAYTAANALAYEGRADDVTVTAGTTGLVSLTLQELAPPPPFTNEAPVIDSLVASPSTTVAPEGTLTLAARAHDPNTGDSLSYAWTAPAGGFSTPTQASTTWTAPAQLGPVQLTLTVSDSRGASTPVNLTVNVSRGSGTTEVRVGFNAAPTLSALSTTQAVLDVNQATRVSLVAFDTDGDPLTYQWSATCTGTLLDATRSSVTFTPTALPTAACNNCQLNVVVKDDRGGQNTGSLALCVSAAASLHTPPRITRSYQSSLTARGAPLITLEVGAEDDEGSALTFAWTASAGTLGAPTTSTTSSRIAWTAPLCDVSASAPPSITATVTNRFGLPTTRAFGVTVCPPAGSWSAVGSLSTTRQSHVQALLPSGQVLVAGGYLSATASYLATAELYDPATETWSPTGAMSVARARPTLTRLATGKVLVVGGGIASSTWSSSELYDPATGTWGALASMAVPRAQHTATLLSDGRVLIAGGLASGSTLTSAELYDPATNTWSAAGTMNWPRVYGTASLLPDGRVLLAGGHSGGGTTQATAELYDPATNTWSLTGAMSTPRRDQAALVLPSGKLLVAGGDIKFGTSQATAELYDPATGTWSPTASMAAKRTEHTLTLLRSGRVLVSGGSNNTTPDQGTTETYDPATGTWSPAPTMTVVHRGGATTLLSTGQVLITGGFNGSGTAQRATEVYTPRINP